ncbi:hypothetical protein Tco_1387842 [Tanacetum coccineum]
MGVNQVILFEIRCRSLDIPPTVSLFRVFYKLCKQGHWFSFENKTGGRSRKCFKEVTLSLKGWKKKFFLIDRRAISDAMPWRHSDTDVQDDFSNNYNEEHAKRLLRYVIKDAEGQVITMDDFLLLYDWTGTIVSKTQEAVPENQRPRLYIAAAREKKDKLNAAKAIAKRVGEGNSTAPHKKRVRKNQKVANSGSEGTISITPLHQASPKPVEEGVTSAPKSTAGTVTGGTHPVDPEREVVELSKNTRPPTPSVMSVTQPSPDGVAFFDGEFFGSSSNMDLVRRAYQFLGKCVLSQCELLKRHERLNSEHVDLRNQSDVQLEELNRLRNDL